MLVTIDLYELLLVGDFRIYASCYVKQLLQQIHCRIVGMPWSMRSMHSTHSRTRLSFPVSLFSNWRQLRLIGLKTRLNFPSHGNSVGKCSVTRKDGVSTSVISWFLLARAVVKVKKEGANYEEILSNCRGRRTQSLVGFSLLWYLLAFDIIEVWCGYISSCIVTSFLVGFFVC